MPKQYDYPESGIELHREYEWLFAPSLNYLASEVMEALDIEDVEEIKISLQRAFVACRNLHIPLHRNFKKVYRYDGENMIADWKISSLACYLIVINCSPVHEGVAKAQLYFATNTVSPIKKNI